MGGTKDDAESFQEAPEMLCHRGRQLSCAPAYLRHALRRAGLRCEELKRDPRTRQCEYYDEPLCTSLHAAEAGEYAEAVGDDILELDVLSGTL